MIARRITSSIRSAASKLPVVTILGPRQSGKTTLVRAAFTDHEYLNLENPETRERVSRDPRSMLGDGTLPVILDEVQRE